MKAPSICHTVPGSPLPEDPAQAHALFRSVLGALEPVIIRLDTNLEVRFISRIAPEFKLDQVIGAHASRFVSPEDLPAAERCWREALEGRPGFYRSENSPAPGVKRSYETWTAPYDGPDGRGVTLIAVEVTTYREQERRLEQTEASLLLAQEATGLGLWSWDLVRNRVRWNARMEEISGQSDALTLDEYLDQLVHPEDRERLRASSNQLVLRQDSFSTAPYRIVRRDGTTRMVCTLGTVLRDESGQITGIVGGSLDVTSHHQQEEIARQRQRLESIGQLTTGIAHNFNNLLATIIPTLRLLAPSAPEGKRSLADDALCSALRAAKSIEQLSHYARQPPGRPPSSGVAEPVGRAVRLCHGLFETSVEIIERIDDGLPDAAVGDADLEQAIVNLLLNARDAVTQSPAPCITVSAREGSPPAELSWTPETGRAICIAVTDNGHGMDEAVRKRVFEPFFTTKPPGRGTGLGLATVDATVRRVGGIVRCISEVGRGTRFELWFAAGSALSTDASSSAAAVVHGDGQLVLIVDDERGIVQTTALLLEDARYRVVTASSCQETLDRVKQHPDIAAVILDRWLTDGNGIELVDTIREALPRAAVFIHSGAIVSTDEQRRFDGLLAKPVPPERLLSALSSGLARRASRPSSDGL